MAGMIKSSIHHFDGFVGLAGNGGGSGKDGRGAAICGALLVSTGIDTVETTFGVMSTVSVGCKRRDWRCRGRAVAGVLAGHDWRRRLPGPLQQVLGAARPALIPASLRVHDSIRPPLAIVAGRRLAFGGACARADQQQRNCNGQNGLGHAARNAGVEWGFQHAGLDNPRP